MKLAPQRSIPVSLALGTFGQAFGTLSGGCPVPVNDPEVTHFTELDRWLSKDPASYARWIDALGEKRLHEQLSADYLRALTTALLAKLRNADLAPFACGEAMQICLADLVLIEELDRYGLPATAVHDLRRELLPESTGLVYRLVRNLAIRAWVANPATTGRLGPVTRLADDQASTPSDLIRHDPSEPLLIIVTAGRGTRLRTTIPKGLVPVGGMPMITYVMDAAQEVGIRQLAFVLKYRAGVHYEYLSRFGQIIVQAEANGTGHSAMQGLAALSSREGTVVLAYSDTPFLSADSFRRLTESFPKPREALRISTFIPADRSSGRIVRDGSGRVLRVEQPRLGQGMQNREGDGGLYAVHPGPAFRRLGNITNDNLRREYYFTDIVAELASAGCTVTAAAGPREEFYGVNAPDDLVFARLRAATGTIRDAQWRTSLPVRQAREFFAAYGGPSPTPADGAPPARGPACWDDDLSRTLEAISSLVGPVLDLGMDGN